MLRKFDTNLLQFYKNFSLNINKVKVSIAMGDSFNSCQNFVNVLHDSLLLDGLIKKSNTEFNNHIHSDLSF